MGRSRAGVARGVGTFFSFRFVGSVVGGSRQLESSGLRVVGYNDGPENELEWLGVFFWS